MESFSWGEEAAFVNTNNTCLKRAFFVKNLYLAKEGNIR